MTKTKKGAWILVAALMAVSLMSGIWSVTVTASAAPTGTREVSSAAVTIDELKARHGVTTVYGLDTSENRNSALSFKKPDTNNVIVNGWGISAGNVADNCAIVIPKEVTQLSDNTTGSFKATDPAKLLGIIFEAGSNIKTIDEGVFEGCSSLRFIVFLGKPAGSFTIGAKAFFRCNALRDLVIPEGCTSIGSQAFGKDYNLRHVTIPTTLKSLSSSAFSYCFNLVDIEYNANITGITDKNMGTYFPYAMNRYADKAKFEKAHGTSVTPAAPFDGRSYLYTTPSGFAFSKNTLRGSTSVLADISGASKTYTANDWYLVGLAALEDKGSSDKAKSAYKEYVLPSSLDFDTARASTNVWGSGIAWDYLDESAKKVRNEDLTGSVSSYDISARAFYYTVMEWKFVISDAVKIIGDQAFYSSQINFIDIGKNVTHIGAEAFRGSNRVYFSTDQYVYFRKTEKRTTNVGVNAFAVAPAWNTEGGYGSTVVSSYTPTGSWNRKVIFTNYAAYNAEGSTAGTTKFKETTNTGVSITWLVDVNTVVDGVAPVSAGKRLKGFAYNVTHNTGDGVEARHLDTWTAKSDADVPLPTIEGNASTVWYTNSEYSTLANKTWIDTALRGATVLSVDLYTKKLSAPTLSDRTISYSSILSSGSLPFVVGAGIGITSDTYDPETNDYSAVLHSYEDSFGNTGTKPASIDRAGTYIIEIRLGKKWGVWEDSVASACRMTLTVERVGIDLYDKGNLSFVTDDGHELADDVVTTLWQYDDGWYTQEMTDGKTLISRKDVLRSYIRYDSSEKGINARNNDSYTAAVLSGGTGTDSARYTLRLTLTVKDGNNYYFTTGTSTPEIEQRGLEFDNFKNNRTVVEVSKAWYIVRQTNWVSYGTALGDTAPGYSVIAIDGAHGWTYGDTKIGGAAIVINQPVLAHGGSSVEMKFSLTLDNMEIVSRNDPAPISDYKKYINTSMPAGVYSIRISGDEYTDPETGIYYPPVAQSYELTVGKRSLTSAERATIEKLFKDKTFYRAYKENGVFIHDYLDYSNTTALSGDIMLAGELKTLLDNDIHALRNSSLADNNAWKYPRFDSYYEPLKLSYNLDRMKSSRYYTCSELLGSSSVRGPVDVDSYTVYYQLTASSLGSLWDPTAANADTVRREYSFDTVIYREITVPEIASVMYGGEDGVRPIVGYSPYYSNDAYSEANKYVNVDDTHYVTFTLHDTKLSRWSDELLAREDVEYDSSKTDEVKLKFAITAADNRWLQYPRMAGWSYDSFDRNAYTISSRLLYESAVYYGFTNSEGVRLEFTDARGKRVTEFTVDESGRVPAYVESVLNTLPEGDYFLYSRAEADPEHGNFNGLNTDSNHYDDIRVTKAVNRWLTPVSVSAWAVGEWNRAESTPKGVPYFGDVNFKITGSDADSETVYYEAILREGETEVEELMIPTLDKAEAGWYRLYAVVEGKEGCYNGLNDDPDNPTYIEFQIFQGSVDRPPNRWITGLLPTMDSWTAGDTASMPSGEALRGERFDSYFEAVYNNETRRYEAGTALGDIPTEPGYYIIRMEIRNYEEGVHIEKDDLTADVLFQIRWRVNEWTVSPSISGWDLGGTASEPVAESLFTGKNVDFKYKLKGQDDSLAVSEKPNKVGDYVLIATATAEYVEHPLVAYVEFSITLTVNRWTITPSLKDYAQGETPSLPTGEALFGEIEYVYMTRDGEILDGPPTTEGEYTLYAKVEVDGFETIEASYDFTVGPEFNRMLVSVNSGLAVIACILTIVVITFAVRRYRQC